jgi:hypothetical protein
MSFFMYGLGIGSGSGREPSHPTAQTSHLASTAGHLTTGSVDQGAPCGCL